jgi:hypothetical protein
LFFKIESWNFQLLFETDFRENTENLTKFQLNQITNRKIENNNCLNELKFCEVSRNSILNKFWKFQLSILKNKKVLFINFFFQAVVSKYAKIDPKYGTCCPNFQWRFWFILLLWSSVPSWLGWEKNMAPESENDTLKNYCSTFVTFAARKKQQCSTAVKCKMLPKTALHNQKNI